MIGGRARLVIASPRGPACVSAEAVAGEIYRHIPRLATKRKLDPSLLYAALLAMPIDWQPPYVYEPRREEALARIGSRDPDDWPTLALALALEVPVWSQDKDFSIASVHVVTTGNLLDALDL